MASGTKLCASILIPEKMNSGNNMQAECTMPQQPFLSVHPNKKKPRQTEFKTGVVFHESGYCTTTHILAPTTGLSHYIAASETNDMQC